VARRERELAAHLFAGGDVPEVTPTPPQPARVRTTPVAARARTRRRCGFPVALRLAPASRANTLDFPLPARRAGRGHIHAYGNLADLLEAAFRRHAKRDALDCMDSRLSFGDLELSTAWAPGCSRWA
jgi:hypothetical protein